MTQGRWGLWDKGWESVEVLRPPPATHVGTRKRCRKEASGAPILRPGPGSKAQNLAHTWSLSPTSTIVISPTISIQLVPQGL